MTDTDVAMLEFERRWWQLAGAKEAAIADRFSMTATRYYQRLNRVLDDPEALAFDAQLVNRLRRIRSARANARGRNGIDRPV